MKITDVKVHALKPFGAIKNNNQWEVKKNVFSFVRVITDEGIEGCGVSSLTGGNPMALESSINLIKSVLIGKDPLDRERIYYELNFTGSFFRINRFFNSAVDCALWDIAGKSLGLPVYKLLGGYRDKIRAYASTLAYSTVDEYVRLGHVCEDAGFTALKLHGFNEPDRDIELCEAMRSEFPHMDLMLDSLCAYDRAGAVRVGRVLDRLNYYWYESPLREEDIEGHCMLRRKLDVPIAGTELNQIGFLDYPEYITRGAVDIVRTFGDYIGGITPMIKTAHLCEAHHIKNEPHSFGPTLVQAAHFHIMLAIRNCDFFESPVPEGVFDAGMKDTIRVQKDGMVYAPTKPGLGYEIDWDYIDNETDRVF
ncbi:MAG TPA: enolase C-terminal domain-like protein [Clostridia bacterium]|nr:enolase C-terminal domain-like protein [Clostridia bacterium]